MKKVYSLFMTVLLLCISASAATANHVAVVDFSADCDGFDITLTGATYLTCNALYSIALSPVTGAAPVVVSGFIPLPVGHFDGYQGTLPVVYGADWGTALCGNFTVTGTVELECTKNTTVYQYEQEALPESYVECPCSKTMCTRTPGYWKNHPEAWPVDQLLIGDEYRDQEDLLELLNTPVKGNADIILTKHLIAAKLNVLMGAGTDDILQTIDNADDYLAAAIYKKKYAENLKNILDDFNNSGEAFCD